MNCNEYTQVLHAYFMGELSARDVRQVDEHAAGCESCGALMKLARELSCREFTEFLDDYIEGRLAQERRAVFERHLAICSDCRNYLQSYRETVKLSALALGPSQLPAQEIPAELVRAILAAAPKKKPSGDS